MKGVHGDDTGHVTYIRMYVCMYVYHFGNLNKFFSVCVYVIYVTIYVIKQDIL